MEIHNFNIVDENMMELDISIPIYLEISDKYQKDFLFDFRLKTVQPIIKYIDSNNTYIHFKNKEHIINEIFDKLKQEDYILSHYLIIISYIESFYVNKKIVNVCQHIETIYLITNTASIRKSKLKKLVN